MRLSRTRLLLVAVAAPIALIAATTAPASAAAAATAVVAGEGDITPGLTAVPSPQTFSFNGTATVTGHVNGENLVLAARGISASGSDLAGSYAAGAGPLTVSIDGVGSFSGYFVRVGAVVEVTLVGVAYAAVGVCAFTAHQLPPATVTSYSVTCGSLAINAT